MRSIQEIIAELRKQFVGRHLTGVEVRGDGTGQNIDLHFSGDVFLSVTADIGWYSDDPVEVAKS